MSDCDTSAGKPQTANAKSHIYDRLYKSLFYMFFYNLIILNFLVFRFLA